MYCTPRKLTIVLKRRENVHEEQFSYLKGKYMIIDFRGGNTYRIIIDTIVKFVCCAVGYPSNVNVIFVFYNRVTPPNFKYFKYKEK